MNTNNHINYIEFKTNDISAVKKFYESVFDWKFTDYGDEYTAFENSGLGGGGFVYTNEKINNGCLIVIYHDNLESVREKVKENGGEISQDIFSFPGGQRFHFLDPTGNELAVWSE